METLFHLHQPGFSKFVSASFILHMVILTVALFAVKGSQGRIFITPTYTKVNLIAPSTKSAVKKKTPGKALKRVQVKKKAAPPVVRTKKKTIALKKAKTPPVPAKVEKKVSIEEAMAKLEKKVAEDKEDMMVAAMIERLAKKNEAKQREKDKLLDELRAEIADYGEANKSVDVGTGAQQVSANASEGLSSEIFDLQFKSYYNKVGSKIQSLWIYPGNTKRDLLTLITIKINKQGVLIDYWIEKKSKDPLFDKSALRAVEKAAPLPPLPADYNEDSIEIGLRFCPGGCVENK